MKDHFDSIISRQTLLWLLVTNVAVLSPQFEHATPWTMAICAICLVWRIGIYFGKVAAPPKLLVTTLAIGAAVTLALVSSEIGLLNALINLLILGYALKYIEMREQRDVKAVVLVGYFIIALTLLDQQGIVNTLHLLMVTAINTCVLLSVYHAKSTRANVVFASKLLLQSIPLAILLFIIFPRLGPLWMVPNIKNATTGLSDNLSFGDISQLTRSADLAFRASFDGSGDGSDNTQLSNQDLYWRALVMENYDGKTWSQDSSIKDMQRQSFYQKAQRKQPSGEQALGELNYIVIAEPSYQKWLYGLDEAFNAQQNDDSPIVELADYRLYSLRPLDQRVSYRVTSFPNSVMDVNLSKATRDINLALPEGNEKTRELASAFAAQYQNPKDRVNAMMNYFSKQSFYYTLSPPKLGKQQVDDFLFENRAGFCAHYASALVFMARASGIPARMVTGYQGGEYNPRAGYYSVYQYMAHAWTEVWLEGKGWQRFDPTAMIAPERILDGFDATFDSQSSYLQDRPFSTLRMKQYPWLNEIRTQFASLDYYWSVWVLGFDEERKQQVLKKLLGEVNTRNLALFMLLSILVIILVIAYYAGLFERQHKQDIINRRYLILCQRFAKRGLSKPLSMPPSQFASFVEQALSDNHLTLAQDFIALTQVFCLLKYQELTTTDANKNKRLFNKLYIKITIKLWGVRAFNLSKVKNAH